MAKKLCYSCYRTFRAGEEYNRHRRSCGGQPERAKHTSSAKWKRLRAAIIERDGGRCQQCATTRRLTVAHIDRNWRNDDPTNLICLCEPCHKRFDAAQESA